MPLLLTGTINVAAGISLSPKFSLDLSIIGNPLKTSDFSLQMVAIQPGVRYWFSQTNYAHFLGAHTMVGMYDMADKEFTYKGVYAGLGISYGYAWVIKKRINITAEIGLGILYTSNDQIQKNYAQNEDYLKYRNQQIIFAPTKFAVNFVYLF